MLKNSILRVLSLSVCVICLCCSLIGCSSSSTLSDYVNTESDYNMEYALDAGQYCMFVSKQINAIMNQTSTTTVIVHDVINNGYPASDAHASLEAALKIVTDSKEQIEFMFPPEQYRDNYNNVLRVIENIESRYGAMIEILTASSPDLARLSSESERMSTDATALASEANVYYK